MGFEDDSGGSPIITSGWVRALMITGVGGGLATLLPMMMESRYHQMVERTGQGTNGPVGAMIVAILLALTVGACGGGAIGITAGRPGASVMTRMGVSALGVVAASVLWVAAALPVWLVIDGRSPQTVVPGSIWALVFSAAAAPASAVGMLLRRAGQGPDDGASSHPAR